MTNDPVFVDLFEHDPRNNYAGPEEQRKIIDKLKLNNVVFQLNDTLFIYGSGIPRTGQGGETNPEIIMAGILQYFQQVLGEEDTQSGVVHYRQPYNARTGEWLGEGHVASVAQPSLTLNVLGISLAEQGEKADKIISILKQNGIKIIDDKETLGRKIVEKLGEIARNQATNRESWKLQ